MLPSRSAFLAYFGLGLLTAQLAPSAAAGKPTPTPYVWKNEPTSYRGVAFGASLDDAKKKIAGLECVALKRGLLCSSSFNVDGASVRDHLTFLGDGLVEVTWVFDYDDYDRLRPVFIDKYGPPRTSRTSTFSSGGETFPMEDLLWGPGRFVMLRLVTHVSNAGSFGSARFLTKIYGKQFDKEVEEQRKKAKEAF